jgi:hypothetical protein
MKARTVGAVTDGCRKTRRCTATLGGNHFNAGAELAGLEEVSANTEDDYVALASKLIEDPALRRQYGKRLQDRFQSNFRPADLGPKYLDFMPEVVEYLDK